MGRGRKGEGGKGYEPVTYQFEDGSNFKTAFFGTGLYKKAKETCEINKWIIFGSNQSTWSEVIQILDEEDDELFTLYSKVFNEENKGISDETFDLWNAEIQKRNKDIRLVKVDLNDYRVYINTLVKEIPSDRIIDMFFDMTHALRYMPVVIAFSLMLLKYIKKIDDMRVFYGALDLREDWTAPAPVIEIDFINDLVELTEAAATYKNSGYFVKLFELLGIKDTLKTYFNLEMNRSSRQELSEIFKGIDSQIGDPYKKELLNILKRELEPMKEMDKLDERMVERAKFFSEKNQYLKALVLLFEGILRAVAFDIFRQDDYEKIRHNIVREIDYRNLFKQDQKTFDTLRKTRNAAVHGSYPNSSDAQRCISIYDNYEKLFRKSLSLYSKIKRGYYSKNNIN